MPLNALTKLFVSGGEIIIALILITLLAVVAGRKRNFTTRAVFLLASLPIGIAVAVLLQRPWRNPDSIHIHSTQTINGIEFGIVQVYESPVENYQRFGFRAENGKWMIYHFMHEQPYWLTAGIREGSSNTVELTRWGIPIGVFHIEQKKLVRLHDRGSFSTPVRENSNQLW